MSTYSSTRGLFFIKFYPICLNKPYQFYSSTWPRSSRILTEKADDDLKENNFSHQLGIIAKKYIVLIYLDGGGGGIHYQSISKRYTFQQLFPPHENNWFPTNTINFRRFIYRLYQLSPNLISLAAIDNRGKYPKSIFKRFLFFGWQQREFWLATTTVIANRVGNQIFGSDREYRRINCNDLKKFYKSVFRLSS